MIRTIAFCFLLLSIGALANGTAPYVTGVYEPMEGGYRLYFMLYNTFDEEAIRGWSVYTDDSLAPVGPPEWNIYHTYKQVQWSTDELEPWNRLPAGQSLGGFEYTAANEPDVLPYLIMGAMTGGYVGEVEMVPIPEPSSLLALGGGLMGLAGLALRRRHR
jgi:hypothetical protein